MLHQFLSISKMSHQVFPSDLYSLSALTITMSYIIQGNEKKKRRSVYLDFTIWKCSDGSSRHPRVVNFPTYSFYPRWRGRGVEITILPFLTFLAYRAQDCSHSGAVPRVQFNRVDSSAPSYTVGSNRKSVSWSQKRVRGCENTICNCCQIRWYIAPNNTCLS